MSSRVSRMRVGETSTNVDSSALTAADARQADSDHAAAMVTAMPIAKYMKGRRRSVFMEDLPRSRRAETARHTVRANLSAGRVKSQARCTGTPVARVEILRVHAEGSTQRTLTLGQTR